MSTEPTLARLLERALDAMNHAVRLTVETGRSSAGMEYVADWLNGSDAVDEQLAAFLGDRPFPPDNRVA